MSRTIFIGDVHGCSAELREMIRTLDVSAQDRVIMLGDLINRGPDSAGTVAFVMEQGFECLMGNHEYEYLKHHPTSEHFGKMRRELGDERHRWIKERPLFIEEDTFLAVHAGLQPHTHPKDTEPRVLLNIRTWDGSGKNMNDPENPPWYDFYEGARPVFYGHWARAGLNLRQRTFGLDSGCVYGRGLSAYVLETHELVQVASAQVYYVPPSLRGTDNE